MVVLGFFVFRAHPFICVNILNKVKVIKMSDFKKFWLRSKIVLVNGFVAIASFAGIVIDNFRSGSYK